MTRFRDFTFTVGGAGGCGRGGNPRRSRRGFCELGLSSLFPRTISMFNQKGLQCWVTTENGVTLAEHTLRLEVDGVDASIMLLQDEVSSISLQGRSGQCHW